MTGMIWAEWPMVLKGMGDFGFASWMAVFIFISGFVVRLLDD